jgi:hypothetical protein
MKPGCAEVADCHIGSGGVVLPMMTADPVSTANSPDLKLDHFEDLCPKLILKTSHQNEPKENSLLQPPAAHLRDADADAGSFRMAASDLIQVGLWAQPPSCSDADSCMLEFELKDPKAGILIPE